MKFYRRKLATYVPFPCTCAKVDYRNAIIKATERNGSGGSVL
jgi:hypothetical protein